MGVPYDFADAYGRYQRMRGRALFQPIGFNAFGIHTENFALRVGEHPMRLTGGPPRPSEPSCHEAGWAGTGLAASTPAAPATTAGPNRSLPTCSPPG